MDEILNNNIKKLRLLLERIQYIFASTLLHVNPVYLSITINLTDFKGAPVFIYTINVVG